MREKKPVSYALTSELRPGRQDVPMLPGGGGLDPNSLFSDVVRGLKLGVSLPGGVLFLTGPVGRSATYEATGSELWTFGGVTKMKISAMVSSSACLSCLGRGAGARPRRSWSKELRPVGMGGREISSNWAPRLINLVTRSVFFPMFQNISDTRAPAAHRRALRGNFATSAAGAPPGPGP